MMDSHDDNKNTDDKGDSFYEEGERADDIIYIADVCDILGISRDTARIWAGRGAFGRVGRHPINNWRMFKRTRVEHVRTLIKQAEAECGDHEGVEAPKWLKELIEANEVK